MLLLTQLDLLSTTNGQERQQQRDYFESPHTVTTELPHNGGAISRDFGQWSLTLMQHEQPQGGRQPLGATSMGNLGEVGATLRGGGNLGVQPQEATSGR